MLLLNIRDFCRVHTGCVQHIVRCIVFVVIVSMEMVLWTIIYPSVGLVHSLHNLPEKIEIKIR